MMRRATAHGRALAKLALLLLFVAAPTAGDIGSCGQELQQLDAEKFFGQKQFIDCTMCRECGFDSQFFLDSCVNVLLQSTFPDDCFPLVHDGEVCLNALRAADCDEYGAYVDDVAPTVPTECNFCPLGERPAPEGS